MNVISCANIGLYMVFNFKVIALLACFNWSVVIIEAQTCCSAGAPITSSFDITASEEKRFFIKLDYEYNSVNLLIDHDEKLINDPRKRSGHSILFKTDFVLNKHWAFSAFIPVVLQNRTTFSETENAAGLGDLSLLAQYSQYFPNDLSLKWSGGVKLPTGSQYITDDRGINLSPDMQSGSGTFDFIGRMALVKQHIFRPNLSQQTSISYRYNTTNKYFGDPEKIGGRRFKFGNELQLTTAFSYLMVVKTWFVVPELGAQIRYASPNREEGSEASNSGGYWFRIPIGLQLRPNGDFSMRLFGQIPIFHKLEGLQITTNYRVGIQFAYQL